MGEFIWFADLPHAISLDHVDIWIMPHGFEIVPPGEAGRSFTIYIQRDPDEVERLRERLTEILGKRHG